MLEDARGDIMAKATRLAPRQHQAAVRLVAHTTPSQRRVATLTSSPPPIVLGTLAINDLLYPLWASYTPLNLLSCVCLPAGNTVLRGPGGRPRAAGPARIDGRHNIPLHVPWRLDRPAHVSFLLHPFPHAKSCPPWPRPPSIPILHPGPSFGRSRHDAAGDVLFCSDLVCAIYMCQPGPTRPAPQLPQGCMLVMSAGRIRRCNAAFS